MGTTEVNTEALQAEGLQEQGADEDVSGLKDVLSRT
jgi:hypothetical protein